MKNKVYLKKHLLAIFIAIIFSVFLFYGINKYAYQNYTKNFNYKINTLINVLKDNGVGNNEIINLINNENTDTLFIDSLGFNIEKESIVSKNSEYFIIFTSFEITLFILLVCLIIYIFLRYNNRKDKELDKITKCIENINNEIFTLDFDNFEEGELAILKSEIYKTTITLKSIASNNLKDKINLKNSLEDISHQLKTPLTSILITLDNLIDNPNMNDSTKEEFLRDIKRDINNIEFLVSSLLKLSKFDANTINFIRKKCLVKDLADSITKNTSTLSDLKNIKIEIVGNGRDSIICDFKWQTEALTNILKNALEYAYQNSTIKIDYNQNSIYTEISITNEGEIISNKDLPHIFERFYKGENSSSESIGIGLNLAKVIIQKDNGTIEVTSKCQKTTFTIKYYHTL